MKVVHNDPVPGSFEDTSQCRSIIGLSARDGVEVGTRCIQAKNHDGWCHDQYVTWPGIKDNEELA